MGPYANDLLPCQSETDVMSGCSCSSNWRMPLQRLAWANSTYNALELLPTAAETATYRGQRQTVQAFFSCEPITDALTTSLHFEIWF